ncbi:MAG: hypothetical protein IPO62_16455 [Saprospiraceae bacterium]|nr:hypothetical protein [Saprospiraceae bacterium]MBK9632619.1 hypothetical protein [Saprospiraceae bacterium]
MIRYIYTFIVLCLFLVSCNEDFQVTEEWKDVPVVYGFIDRTDQAHYIRVEKLFVDENKSAVEIAQIADSLYYANAVVSLYSYRLKTDFQLTRVDGNAEGFQRNPGPFATAPNYLYKIESSKIPLLGGDTVQFRLDRSDNKPLVTSTIVLVKDIAFTAPSRDTREITFKPEVSQTVAWTLVPGAHIYSFEVNVDVLETNKVTGESKIVTIPWVFLRKSLKNSVVVQGIEFYRLLKENLSIDPSIQREISNLRFTVKIGGVEIYDFDSVINANTGITASQEIPRYTNISEGFGLFSSIFTHHRNFGITPETKALLRITPETQALNF